MTCIRTLDSYFLKRASVPAEHRQVYDQLRTCVYLRNPLQDQVPTFAQLRYLARLICNNIGHGGMSDMWALVGNQALSRKRASEMIAGFEEMGASEMGKMKGIYTEMHEKIANLDKEVRRLTVANSELRASLREIEPKYHEKNRSCIALRMQVQDLEKIKGNLQRLYDGAKSQAEALAMDLDTLRPRYDELQKTLEGYMTDTSELRSQRDSAQAEVERLTKELRELEKRTKPFARPPFFGSHFGCRVASASVTYSTSDGIWISVTGPQHSVGRNLSTKEAAELSVALHCAAVQAREDFLVTASEEDDE